MSESRMSLDEIDRTMLLSLLTVPLHSTTNVCPIVSPTTITEPSSSSTEPTSAFGTSTTSRTTTPVPVREALRPRQVITRLKQQVVSLQATLARLHSSAGCRPNLSGHCESISTYRRRPSVWESIARRQLAAGRVLLLENKRLKNLLAQQSAFAQTMNKLLRQRRDGER